MYFFGKKPMKHFGWRMIAKQVLTENIFQFIASCKGAAGELSTPIATVQSMIYCNDGFFQKNGPNKIQL